MKIEEIIYADMDLYGQFDGFLIEVISYQYQIEIHKITEEYEKCTEYLNYVNEAIDETADALCKLDNTLSKKDVVKFLEKTYNEIVNNYSLMGDEVDED